MRRRRTQMMMPGAHHPDLGDALTSVKKHFVVRCVLVERKENEHGAGFDTIIKRKKRDSWTK